MIQAMPAALTKVRACGGSEVSIEPVGKFRRTGGRAEMLNARHDVILSSKSGSTGATLLELRCADLEKAGDLG